ncbi:hypothetical protein MSAN_00147600 [Mycena sanguinolenta]|uniref:Uncharacterized protein n=1 Tax=Mycena sanguinolenta TaxID=230812 RepID=A0A8H6ZE30_9AGAR|nr:hypothetical protein MSAN_00147600 [Mycena sanguinolenta]
MDRWNAIRHRNDWFRTCFSTSFLVRLPVLTHFGIAFKNAWAAVLAREILDTCKTLKVFIFTLNADENFLLSASQNDPRFLLYKPARDEFVRGWIAGTRGGIKFWARGDICCQETARGNPASFLLLDQRQRWYSGRGFE